MRSTKLFYTIVIFLLVFSCLAGCNGKDKEKDDMQEKIVKQFTENGGKCSEFIVIGEEKLSSYTKILYAITSEEGSFSANDYRNIYGCMKPIQSMMSDNFVFVLQYVEIGGIKYAISPDGWSLYEYGETETLYNKIADTPYDRMTNPMKKVICAEIERQYNYYDKIEGKYSGDKYSDIIWKQIEEKYNLSHTEVNLIWMHSYEY